MKKVILISALCLIKVAFGVSIKSSHPIYFTAGDVRPHQSVFFELPYQKMQPFALYDASCQVSGIDIMPFKPIVYAKIMGNALSSEISSSLNGLSMKHPIQDRLISKSNELVIHNITSYTNSMLKMNVYNFDDTATITFSNCYVIVSKQNA